MFNAVLGFLGLLLTVVSAASASPPLPTRVVYQFPKSAWIENLWVRANGDILFTTYYYPNSSVYLISNPSSASPTTSLVYTWTSINSILGIIETRPGVFAVVGGNSSNIAVPVAGTSSVWELDIRGFPRRAATSREIAFLPDALFLNGVAPLPNGPTTTILVGDSPKGVVWRVDTLTCNVDLAIEDPTMVPPANASLPLGINGLTTRGEYLYWTNSIEATIYRLRITEKGLRAPGAKVELVAGVNTTVLDDLTIGPVNEDTIWTVTNVGNTVVAVRNGTATVVAGALDQLILAGSTAAKFGRGRTDKEVLYVSTDGGLASPVNGTLTQGGSIVAIDTKKFLC